MKVLVDTSAWVDFLNDYPSPQADDVEYLLGSEEEVCACGVVVMEVLQGLRLEGSFPRALLLFESLTLVEAPGLDVYLRAAGLYRQLRARGVTVRSAIDCLIVALAESHDCWVLARDRDLTLILDSGLTRVLAWSLPPPAPESR